MLLIVRVFGKLLFHWVFSYPTNLLTCLGVKTRGVTILQNFCFDIGKYINFTTCFYNMLYALIKDLLLDVGINVWGRGNFQKRIVGDEFSDFYTC